MNRPDPSSARPIVRMTIQIYAPSGTLVHTIEPDNLVEYTLERVEIQPGHSVPMPLLYAVEKLPGTGGGTRKWSGPWCFTVEYHASGLVSV